jgi:archaellum component FlaG (FlaF/FlaG flagellin family)
MGMGNIVVYVVLFIVTLGLAFVLISSHALILKEKSDSMITKSDIIEKKINTDYSVVDLKIKNGKTVFTLKNVGGEQLRPELISVYVGPNILNSSQRNISLVPKYDIINPGIWDGGELLNISINYNFNFKVNNTIVISTENGRSKAITFVTKKKKARMYYAFW